ncbi:hypothetical protein TCAL_13566 [Tigriopus californicus]|uniref:Phospholipase A2 n=1 Tax=Tigriopus californicus TaxID=6832 RepID=A0A553PES7_TIGCA|nr:hypothetical protein TCAL_13566 [Tigriopus californicus]
MSSQCLEVQRSIPRSVSAPEGVGLPMNHEIHPKPDSIIEDNFPNSIGNYQVFQINQSKCQRLLITIVRGKGITRGKIKDWLYSPDPYVSVQLIGTPNGLKKTKYVTSCSEPLWNETLIFYFDSNRDRLIEIVLYDLNRTVNEEIGRDIVDIYGLYPNKDHAREIAFKNGSRIEINLRVESNPNLDLKCGTDLCDEELQFREHRRPRVAQGIKNFLDFEIPNEEQIQVPTICLMTSGGGFRAMIAYAGAFKVLVEAGVIDMITYTSALSGSSWFLSTLYTHPGYPEDKEVVNTILSELKACVEKHWQVHLSPPWSSRYLKKIIRKSVGGQPVSFTDFYGYLVGQQLLKRRMKYRLSDQRDKIAQGQAPMPIYTCLHVKSNVSAKVFQEWYEFNPYGVGIPKYGAYMKSEDFACKFYMGKVVKRFPEVPLHFLYGIWGSAFTILFKRLVQERGRNCQGELLKMISGRDMRTGNELGTSEEEDLIVRCLAEDCNEESDIEPLESEDAPTESHSHTYQSNGTLGLQDEEIIFDGGCKSEDNDDEDFEEEEDERCDPQALPTSSTQFARQTGGGSSSADELEEESLSRTNQDQSQTDLSMDSGLASSGSDIDQLNKLQLSAKTSILTKKTYALRQKFRKYSLPRMKKGDRKSDVCSSDAKTSILTKKTYALRQKFRKYSLPRMKKGKKGGLEVDSQSSSDSLPAIGTSLRTESSTSKIEKVSPTPSERIQAIEEENSKWDRILERALSTTPINSRAFRAGVILNPLRGITAETVQPLESCPASPVKPTDTADCDFKGFRESMKTDEKKIYLVDSGLSFNLPFPLMLRPQQKWARLHGLPFPPVREAVKTYLDQPIKECYVFKDLGADINVPVIIFFPLINANFRHFKAPGIPRVTDDEKSFGDFNIFDDTNAYAIWRFVYPNLSFDRLTAMMEFNVRNNLHIIREEIELLTMRV